MELKDWLNSINQSKKNLIDEDASIEKIGNFTGPIYSIELLGDSTIVTLKIKNNLIHVKTSNNFSSKIGEIVSVKIPNNLCHFFDSKTGIHL